MDGDVRRKISVLQNRLQELNQKSSKSDWQDMTELMVNLYRHQAEMQKTGGMGITTGFKGLDKESGGFHPGQLVVIGARPSVGKSALAGQMAVSMASSGLTVGIISLEMNNNEIAARLAAIDAEIDFNVLYRGLYSDERQRDWVYERIGRHTSTLKIFVSDKTDVNINEIRVKAQKLKHLHGLDCLFIDYLQLIDSDETKNSNRENEIRKISRGAKIMAKEMNIPVIELCQLNREVTKRKGHERYPQLSDLRESGSIEQDADVVMFLHRDFMSGIEVDENGNSTQNQADIVVRKWRNGNANFIYPLDFDPPKMKFRERGQFSSWKRVETTGIDDENPF
jgi:replicative DNA helicase